MCRFEVSRNLLDELKQARLKLWKKWTEINSEQIWEDMVPAGWRFFARCFHHRKCKAWDFFWHNIWLGTNFQPFHMQAWNEVPRTSGEDGRPKFLVAWSIVWFRRHTPKQNCHVLQSRRLWWTATNFAGSNQQCDQKGCRGKSWKTVGEVASRIPGHCNIATCHFIAKYCLVKNDTCTDLIWHILFICKNDAWKFDEFHTSKYAGEKNNSGLVLQDARGENKGPVIMINESILYTVIMFSILPNLNLVAWFANLTFMLCFEFDPFWFQLCCLAVAGCRNYCPSCRDELG